MLATFEVGLAQLNLTCCFGLCIYTCNVGLFKKIENKINLALIHTRFPENIFMFIDKLLGRLL